ncbi:MAG TPA: class I SAM-dependent methyltransferase [Acidimicrobiales bacterium]|nr:class I SAM-dependent methyltransferase [Acidimicrobiales bacterium]
MTTPNEEQRRRWDEEEGDHWVAEAAHFDKMLGPYGDHVIAGLSPEPAEKILDVGCGSGALSLDVAARVGPQGHVLGLDLSGPMLSLAKQRAGERGLGNVSFEKSDVQVHEFEAAGRDAVMSRFGVMFFDEPVVAFANLRGAVRSGGRLAFVCWQEPGQNDWLMVPAATMLEFVPMPEMPAPGAPGPFGLADPDRTRSILGDAGWSDIEVEAVEIQQWLGGDPATATNFVSQTQIAQLFLGETDDATKARAWKAVEGKLAEFTDADGVHLTGRTWLVTATNP